jgi:hypothetical protein
MPPRQDFRVLRIESSAPHNPGTGAADMRPASAVFVGNDFFALDAQTGELLWKASVGGQINAGAMSYSVSGRQYVTIAAGSALFAYALP